MALEEAMQGRTREVGNGFLQGVKAVIERELCVLAESHGQGLFFSCEYGRSRLGAHRSIGHGRAVAPLGHGFGIDPAAGG